VDPDPLAGERLEVRSEVKHDPESLRTPQFNGSGDGERPGTGGRGNRFP